MDTDFGDTAAQLLWDLLLQRCLIYKVTLSLSEVSLMQKYEA
jgi:hypothetical protein